MSFRRRLADLIDPSIRRDLSRAASETMVLAASREAAITELRDEQRACARARERFQAALESSLTPEATGCTKVRLANRDEAATYAANVADDLGRPVSDFKTYRCDTCPRHPLTLDRYWHIANVDVDKRTGHAGAAAQKREDRRRQGHRRAQAGRDTVAQRLGADLAEELRQRFAGGEAS